MHLLNKLQSTFQEIIANGNGTYGVVIYHFEMDEYYYHQPDEVFYAASIIKVPIMAAVFAQVHTGAVTLEEKMTVRMEDMVTGSGILQNLTPGFEMSIYDLIVLMIIESDNTATNMLVDRIGINVIQQAMSEWGMVNSEFHHKLQIMPAAEEPGSNRISARDMTDHVKKIAQGKIVSWNACRKMVEIMKQQKFNDNLPGLLPYQERPLGAIASWEMAHKTGYIPGTEHDVGLLYLPGNTFAVSVLGKDIKDRADARRVMNRIGLALYDLARLGG